MARRSCMNWDKHGTNVEIGTTVEQAMQGEGNLTNKVPAVAVITDSFFSDLSMPFCLECLQDSITHRLTLPNVKHPFTVQPL